MYYMLCLFFVISVQLLFGNTRKVDIDSLEFILLTAKKEKKIELLITLAGCYQDSQNSKSLKYAELAFNLMLDQHKDSVNLGSYNTLGDIFNKHSSFRNAISCYSKSLENYKTADDSTAMAEYFHKIAGIITKTGDYTLAMHNFLESLRIARAQNNDEQIAKALVSIARLNYFMKNYDKALDNLDQALLSAEETGSKETLIRIYNQYGLVYDDLEDFEKSLDNHFKSLEIAQGINNLQSISYSLNNIGLVYISTGKYEHAYDYYLRSMAIKEKLNDKWGIIGACINIGTALVRLGQYEEARKYIDRGLEMSETINMNPLLMYLWDTYYELYSSTGDYQKALEAYMLSTQYKDSIYSRKKTIEIAELQTKYENEKQERELIILKEKENYEQLIRRILIVGIVLLFIVSVIIVVGIIQRRKKDKIISRKEKQILETKLESKESKEKEMRQEIRFKTRQLTTHALHMMQKNEMLNDIINLSTDLLKSPEDEIKPKIRQLRQQLKQNLKTENDWEVFKIHFEQVNTDFFNNLLKVNANMNTYDLRHSALIKLNMNIKESASVLNLSPHSVKSARYRLKKKLNLKPDEDLSDFIRNI